MSTHTLTDAGRSASTAGTTERTAVPAVRLNDDDLADESLAGLEGRLIVLYGDADHPAIAAFDRTNRTGDQSIGGWLAASERAPGVTADDEANRSARLTYHGRVVSRDLPLEDRDPVGVVHLSFLGGDLDETGFAVETDRLAGTGDVEFRVVIVPPILEDDERTVTDLIPDDLEGSAMKIDDRVPYMMVPTSDVTSPPTYYLSGPIEEVQLATPDDVDVAEANPSFETLLNATR